MSRQPFIAAGPQTRWPAILVFVAVSAATVVSWRALDAHIRAGEEHEVRSRAERLARLGEILVPQRLVELRNLVAFWEDSPPDRGEWWKTDARYFLESHSDLLLIASTELGADGDPAPLRMSSQPADGESVHARDVVMLDWFRELNEARGDELFTTRKHALETRSVQTFGPLPTPTGSPVFEIDIPTSPSASRVGLLTIIHRPSELFAPLTASWVRPYAVEVRAGGLSIFEDGVPGAALPESFVAEESLDVGMGETWQVRVAPTQAILGEPRRQFARGVLTVGLVIALLLAVIIQLSHVARGRAGALQSATDELQARLEVIEHREAEIREMNQSLEARVKERTETLHEAVNELETYNYSVAHDLRSPLGAIVNFAAILQEDYAERLDQPGRDYLKRVARCAQTAVSMMDSLLAFSRVGRQKMTLESLEMHETVRSVFSDLSAASRTLPAQLKIDALPACKGDREMLRTVVLNLLSNALKFSHDSKPPRVEVGGYETDEECVYFVRDNGVGFNPERAKQLFGVFERLHSRDEFEGHGVGLAIARRIVQRHGGRVWADSTPGAGATFFFSLPRK